MFKALLCSAAIGLLLVSGASGNNAANNKAKVTVVFDHVLPNAKGKSMKGVLVEYQPGGKSPAHTHPDSASRAHLVLAKSPPYARMEPFDIG